VTLPVMVRNASVPETKNKLACVAIISLRRSMASASKPPNSSIATCGTARTRPIKPICSGELVSS
jgi:hypothetical protein